MVNPFKIAQACSESKPLFGEFTSITIKSTSAGFDKKKTRKFIPIRENDGSNSLVVIEQNYGNDDYSIIELMMDNLAERMALEEQ